MQEFAASVVLAMTLLLVAAGRIRRAERDGDIETGVHGVHASAVMAETGGSGGGRGNIVDKYLDVAKRRYDAWGTRHDTDEDNGTDGHNDRMVDGGDRGDRDDNDHSLAYGRGVDLFLYDSSSDARLEAEGWLSRSNKRNSYRHGINADVWTRCVNATESARLGELEIDVLVRNRGIARLFLKGIELVFFLARQHTSVAPGEEGRGGGCTDSTGTHLDVHVSLDGGATWLDEANATDSGFLSAAVVPTAGSSNAVDADTQSARVSLFLGHALGIIDSSAFSRPMRVRIQRQRTERSVHDIGPCSFADEDDELERRGTSAKQTQAAWSCSDNEDDELQYHANAHVHLIWDGDVLWGVDESNDDETQHSLVRRRRKRMLLGEPSSSSSSSMSFLAPQPDAEREELEELPLPPPMHDDDAANDVVEGGEGVKATLDYDSDSAIFSRTVSSSSSSVVSSVYSDPTSRSVSQSTSSGSSSGTQGVSDFGEVLYNARDGSLSSSMSVESTAIASNSDFSFTINYTLFDEATGVSAPIAMRPVVIINSAFLAVTGCPPASISATGLTPNADVFILVGSSLLESPFQFATGVNNCNVDVVVANIGPIQSGKTDRRGVLATIINGVNTPSDCQSSYVQVIDLLSCAATDAVRAADVIGISPGIDGSIDPQCGAEANALYKGNVIVDGRTNLLASADQCCAACSGNGACNTWSYCPSPSGCGNGFAFQQCWLKAVDDIELREAWARGDDVPWISGVVQKSSEGVTCNSGESFINAPVLVPGEANVVGSWEECCSSCRANTACNVWNFCSVSDNSCGSMGACWLQQAESVSDSMPREFSPSWISGYLLPQAREGAGDQSSRVTAASGLPPSCGGEMNANYRGSVIVEGHGNLLSSAGACCAACESNPLCNVWVYCGDEDGCFEDYLYQECWLKSHSTPEAREAWDRGSWVPWTSGVILPGSTPSLPATPDLPLSCGAELNSNYKGSIIVQGHGNLQSSAGACCAACESNPQCNVWVYCGETSGCFQDFVYQECWLKSSESPEARLAWERGPFVPWTSGVVLRSADGSTTDPSQIQPAPGLPPSCGAELNSNYKGSIVVQGHGNLLSSAGACCAACESNPQCNVWVYCDDENGCFEDYLYQEGWLKSSMLPEAREAWDRGPHVPWTSGIVMPGSSPAPGDLPPSCGAELNSNYKGSIIVQGHGNLLSSAGACCAACESNPLCNVWVYCGETSGCFEDYLYQECWLKSSATPEAREAWDRGPHVPWTSGVVMPGSPALAPGELPPSCGAELNSNYKGSIIVEGHSNLMGSAGACCAACESNPRCNVWVYCGDEDGCFEDYLYQECWLKSSMLPEAREAWDRGPHVPWTSGITTPGSGSSPSPAVAPGGLPPTCGAELNSNYKGSIIVQGHSNLLSSAGACCAACESNPLCNVWVYCGTRTGCFQDYAYQECWLKSSAAPMARDAWDRGPWVPWTSGALPTSTGGNNFAFLNPPAPPPSPSDRFDTTPIGVADGNIFLPVSGANLVPPVGAYFGVFKMDDVKYTVYQDSGVDVSVFGIFLEIPMRDSDKTRLDSFFRDIATRDVIPLLSMEPWQGLDAVTEEAAAEVARACKAAYQQGSKPCLIRFAHEMNGSWYPWSQQPGLYVSTYRSFVQNVRAVEPCVSFMWSPNYGGGYPFGFCSSSRWQSCWSTSDFQMLDTNRDGSLSMRDDPYLPFYPGDEYVDWVGLSMYHRSSNEMVNEVAEPREFANKLRGEYVGRHGDDRDLPDFYSTFANIRRKPLAISETAAMWYVEEAGGGFSNELAVKESWWSQLFHVNAVDTFMAVDLATNFPFLKMVVWFDYIKTESVSSSQQGSGDVLVDWRFSANRMVLAAFALAIGRSSYFSPPVVGGCSNDPSIGIFQFPVRQECLSELVDVSTGCSEVNGSIYDIERCCSTVRSMRDISCLCNGMVEQLSMATMMNNLQFVVQTRCGLAVPGCPVMYPIPQSDADDILPPIITLNGAALMSVALGEIFVDPGAAAFDQVEGDVTLRIVRDGFVRSTEPGVYTLTYRVSDSAGNVAAEKVRYVRVLSSPTLCGDTSNLQVSLSVHRHDDGTRFSVSGFVLNSGSESMDLDGVVIPVYFSRGVRGPNGLWYRAPASEFVTSCDGAMIVSTSGDRPNGATSDLCDMIFSAMTKDGLVISFGSIVLCPDCALVGLAQGAVTSFQHTLVQELDYVHFNRDGDDGPVVGAPTCSLDVPGSDLQLPGGEDTANVDCVADMMPALSLCEPLQTPGARSRAAIAACCNALESMDAGSCFCGNFFTDVVSVAMESTRDDVFNVALSDCGIDLRMNSKCGSFSEGIESVIGDAVSAGPGCMDQFAFFERECNSLPTDPSALNRCCSVVASFQMPEHCDCISMLSADGQSSMYSLARVGCGIDLSLGACRTGAGGASSPPMIFLVGERNARFNQVAMGMTFIDPGATAFDPEDGDLTERITVSGIVDTSTPGIYVLTYSVVDSSGNVSQATREVEVLPSQCDVKEAFDDHGLVVVPASDLSFLDLTGSLARAPGSTQDISLRRLVIAIDFFSLGLTGGTLSPQEVDVLCLGLRIVDDGVSPGDATAVDVSCDATTLAVEDLGDGRMRASMHLFGVVMCPTCRLEGQFSALFRVLPRKVDFRFNPNDATVSLLCSKTAFFEDDISDGLAQDRTNRCLAIVADVVTTCDHPQRSSGLGDKCCGDMTEFIDLECSCDPFVAAQMQPFENLLTGTSSACSLSWSECAPTDAGVLPRSIIPCDSESMSGIDNRLDLSGNSDRTAMTVTGSLTNPGNSAVSLSDGELLFSYSRWGPDSSGLWNERDTNEFVLECKFLVVQGGSGSNSRNHCDEVTVVPGRNDFLITFGDIELCSSCSLVGGSDGVMFELTNSRNPLLDTTSASNFLGTLKCPASGTPGFAVDPETMDRLTSVCQAQVPLLSSSCRDAAASPDTASTCCDLGVSMDALRCFCDSSTLNMVLETLPTMNDIFVRSCGFEVDFNACTSASTSQICDPGRLQSACGPSVSNDPDGIDNCCDAIRVLDNNRCFCEGPTAPNPSASALFSPYSSFAVQHCGFVPTTTGGMCARGPTRRKRSLLSVADEVPVSDRVVTGSRRSLQQTVVQTTNAVQADADSCLNDIFVATESCSESIQSNTNSISCCIQLAKVDSKCICEDEVAVLLGSSLQAQVIEYSSNFCNREINCPGGIPADAENDSTTSESLTPPPTTTTTAAPIPQVLGCAASVPFLDLSKMTMAYIPTENSFAIQGELLPVSTMPPEDMLSLQGLVISFPFEPLVIGPDGETQALVGLNDFILECVSVLLRTESGELTNLCGGFVLTLADPNPASLTGSSTLEAQIIFSRDVILAAGSVIVGGPDSVMFRLFQKDRHAIVANAADTIAARYRCVVLEPSSSGDSASSGSIDSAFIGTGITEVIDASCPLAVPNGAVLASNAKTYNFPGGISYPDEMRRGDNLKGIVLTYWYSRWVTASDGSLIQASVSDFEFECVRSFMSSSGPGSGPPDTSTDVCDEISLDVADMALTVTFGDIPICDGCMIESTRQDGTLFTLTTANKYDLDPTPPEILTVDCAGRVPCAPLETVLASMDGPKVAIVSTGLASTGLGNTLPDGGNITIFTPTDAAFQEALDAAGMTVDEFIVSPFAESLLRNHIAAARLTTDDLARLDAFESVEGTIHPITTTPGGGIQVGGCNVIDSAVESCEASIIKIDCVLQLESPSPPPTASPPPPQPTCVPVATALSNDSYDFSMLLTALDVTGVDETIAAEDGVTLLAPTDDAITAFIGGFGLPFEDFLVHPEATALLRQHIADVPLTGTDLVLRSSFESLDGQVFPLEATPMGLTVNGCDVLKTDIDACGATIHVIDCVLMVDSPPPPSLSPPPPPPTAACRALDAALFESGFPVSTFVTALEATGVDSSLRASENGATVFVPVDSAFESFLNESGETVTDLLTSPSLESILRSHIANTELSSADLASFSGLESVSGDVFPVESTPQGVKVNGCNVLGTDIDACGLTVHVIDCVLVMKAPPLPPPPASCLPLGPKLRGDNGDVYDVSILKTALDATGLQSTIEQSDGMTLFAPTDAAFDGFLRGTGMSVDDFLVSPGARNALQHHLSGVRLSSQSLAGFTAFENLNRQMIPVEMSSNGLTVDGCNVLEANIEVCGATVYVIDCMLVLKALETPPTSSSPPPPFPASNERDVLRPLEDDLFLPPSEVLREQGLEILSWNREASQSSPEYVDAWFKIRNNLPYSVSFKRLQVGFFFGTPGGEPSDYVMDSYRALTEAGNDFNRYSDRSTSLTGTFLEGAKGRDDAYMVMDISFGPRAGVLQAGRTSGEIIVQGRKHGVVPGGILGQYTMFRDSIGADEIPAYSSLDGGDVLYRPNPKMVLLLDSQRVWGDVPEPLPPAMLRSGWMEVYYKFIPAGIQRTRFSVILAAKGDTPIRISDFQITYYFNGVGGTPDDYMVACYGAGLMASKGDMNSRCAEVGFAFAAEGVDAQPGRFFSLTLRFLTEDLAIGPLEHTDGIEIEIYKSSGEYLLGGSADYSAMPEAVDTFVPNMRIAVHRAE